MRRRGFSPMGLAQSEEDAGREGRHWALERQRRPCAWRTLAGSGPGTASVNAGRTVGTRVRCSFSARQRQSSGDGRDAAAAPSGEMQVRKARRRREDADLVDDGVKEASGSSGASRHRIRRGSSQQGRQRRLTLDLQGSRGTCGRNGGAGGDGTCFGGAYRNRLGPRLGGGGTPF